MKKNIGSSFDSWLHEEGIEEEVTAVAIRRVMARPESGDLTGVMDRVCAKAGNRRDEFVSAAAYRVLGRSVW